MPQHKSAKKSVRQDARRRLVNRKRKGVLKSNMKSVLLAIEEKDIEKAKKAFFLIVPVIDRLVAKGQVHKNKAARTKSRLWHKIGLLSQSAES